MLDPITTGVIIVAVSAASGWLATRDSKEVKAKKQLQRARREHEEQIERARQQFLKGIRRY